MPLNTPEKEAGAFSRSLAAKKASKRLISLPGVACSEYIQALIQCHERGLMTRLTGGCNDQKQALTMCLRQEVGPPGLLNSGLAHAKPSVPEAHRQDHEKQGKVQVIERKEATGLG